MPGGNTRGVTAFRWQKSLVVDQEAKRAVMEGDVFIANRADAPGAEVVNVTGDRAIALFAAKPATQPATGQAAAKPSESDAGVQLRWLTIDGNLVVRRGDSTLTAHRLDYDPETAWMAALGTERNPAVFQNATDTVMADQIFWNAQTWMTRFVNIRGRGSSGQ